MTNANPSEIHSGENTHHQLQVITPTNLRTMKTTSNIVANEVPPVVLFSI